MDPVGGHLLSVLASDVFTRAPASSALLAYLVDCARAGSVPKEYAIATEALRRPADFDPRSDPAVRVEVRRLRQKLAEYYAGAGRDSEVVFEIPKGAYAVSWQHRSRAAARLSLAVLPLANLTGDPAKEYFADGLTEELTSELARSEDLHVVARTSAFVFKDRAADVREIGRRLNVAMLVEGSVRWAGGRVRATVQLIETDTGFHRWAHTHEVDEGDLLRCQQDLAVRIREALLPRIKPVDAGPDVAGPPSADALTLFLRARHHWNARTPAGVRKALQLLEELTTRYPGYAAPWALRAECYCVLGLDAPATTREFGQLALACSERALGLAPHAAEAHAASGWAKGEYLFDHAAAEFHLKRALELKPGFVTARYVWGVAACALRRFDEGLRYLESAAALDPLSMLAQRGVAYAWFVRGDLHRAREHVLQALDLAPAAPFALYLHGLIEAEAGNTDPGIDLLRAAITQAGGTWPFIEGFVAYYLGRSGRAAEAAAAAKGLAALSPPPHMALALADLGGGRRGSAIAHLEAAARAGDPFVVHIADHPPFPHLMGEGRFDALCRRLNLPVQG